MSSHVLHVLDDLAKAWHTDQIADAAAQHYVYDEAQEWVSPQTWTEAACVLIEADTLDQVASQGPPPPRSRRDRARPGRRIDLPASGQHRRREHRLLPADAHIVTRTILRHLNPISA